jgi:hypothetical protein
MKFTDDCKTCKDKAEIAGMVHFMVLKTKARCKPYTNHTVYHSMCFKDCYGRRKNERLTGNKEIIKII